MTARSGAVLVVDDDKINRIMLSKLLENDGYRPTTVVDGESALEAVAKESFDAVLLDVMVPGIDGISVLQSLKRDSRWWHIPVVMISAVEDTDAIARCIELGAEDFLLKPFDPVLLRARVNTIVDVTVVEGAIRRGDAVVTSDEDHIRRIASAARITMRIERI